MPGINGYISSAAVITDAAELIERMEAVNWWPHAPQVTKRVQSPRAVITNTLTGLWKNLLDQPASDPDGRVHLLLEGQLFNWEEIARNVAERWARTPCQKLVALFLRDDVDFIKRLDGEFNLVIYQPAMHRLLIFNDRLGSKPFYYLPQPHALLFGSEKKAMLALANPLPELDPVGLLQLVAYRHHVGGRTLHKGIACLPPATCLEFSDDGLRLTRYAHLRFQARTIPRNLTPLLEEWGALLCEGTRRRLVDVGSLLLSLSGGLDSRAVACALYRTRSPQLARTLGETTSAEVQAAFAIARRLGFNHRLEAPGSVPLSTLLPDIVWRTDGAVPFTHGMTLAYHLQLKQQADFMAGGWFGDASSGAHLATFMLMPYARTEFINRVHTWYTQYHQPALRALFQPAFIDNHREELAEIFHTSFAPLAAEENWQTFELWDLQERQTRMTFAAAPVDSHLFELVRPFLDMGYLRFAMSLPPYLRYGQIFYQAMIYHLGPEIRHIPNANTGLLLKGTLRGNMLNRVQARTQRVAARLREKFAPAPYTASLTNRGGLADEIRQDPLLRQQIESFVASDFFDPAIFNRQQIYQVLGEHDQGDRDHAYAISMLATVAEALPRLVYQRPRQPHPQPQVARSA
jgi:hypothetical protein